MRIHAERMEDEGVDCEKLEFKWACSSCMETAGILLNEIETLMRVTRREW